VKQLLHEFSGKVLVVDDDPSIRNLACETLEYAGFEVKAAADGVDAMFAFDTFTPDIILLDVLMPGMNGFQVCREIRSTPRGADVPILIMTGLDDLESIAAAYQSGATDFITKPLQLLVLPYRVQYLVRSSKVHAGRRQAEEERLLLEQQFHQAQKLESLGVLAGGIAHDFNNLLAVIMGHCSLLSLRPETIEKHIPLIEKAAERGADLCRQMLAYAGKSLFVQDNVNIVDLVDEMVAMLKSTIAQNVVIKSGYSAHIPAIKADASQIRQIVMNLIINASEAIGEAQGEILVSLDRVVVRADELEKDHLGAIIPAGHYVCLEVIDDGCGMDKDIQQRLFEPFYTTKFTGRGLGMSAVLGIIKARKGALKLHSHPGLGSAFKVYLPFQDDDVTIGSAPAQTVSSESWRGSGTVLLVEDEVEVLLIAQAMLEDIGFSVIAACNGKEGLERYKENAADITLVMTDIGMPVMDGYALFGELKALKPELPIILFSGFGHFAVSSRIDPDDMAGFVSKPFRLDQVRDVLKGTVDGQQSFRFSP
jgi:DNA-binding response OmpR family regulator